MGRPGEQSRDEKLNERDKKALGKRCFRKLRSRMGTKEGPVPLLGSSLADPNQRK